MNMDTKLKIMKKTPDKMRFKMYAKMCTNEELRKLYHEMKLNQQHQRAEKLKKECNKQRRTTFIVTGQQKLSDYRGMKQ